MFSDTRYPVSAETGSFPFQEATILVKGTTTGTTTDIDAQFSISYSFKWGFGLLFL